ncbi:unnamed protein product [Lactuca saligna]|uniref:Uncharacterized protein n=1 Tax=Lactuca saligna TaxID=75948 RepID=A0AA36ELI2_LACSI|nr:unnamed protein product [Lactuca saligna]
MSGINKHGERPLRISDCLSSNVPLTSDKILNLSSLFAQLLLAVKDKFNCLSHQRTEDAQTTEPWRVNEMKNDLRYLTSFSPEVDKAYEWKYHLSCFYVSDEETLELWPSVCKHEAREYLKMCDSGMSPTDADEGQERKTAVKTIVGSSP